MSTSFTWSTRREGNVGFVFETHPDGSSVEFGPMPCDLVLKFVAARRQLANHMMRSKSFKLILDPTDWSILQ
jgi:hypothetical protein